MRPFDRHPIKDNAIRGGHYAKEDAEDLDVLQACMDAIMLAAWLADLDDDATDLAAARDAVRAVAGRRATVSS